MVRATTSMTWSSASSCLGKNAYYSAREGAASKENDSPTFGSRGFMEIRRAAKPDATHIRNPTYMRFEHPERLSPTRAFGQRTAFDASPPNNDRKLFLETPRRLENHRAWLTSYLPAFICVHPFGRARRQLSSALALLFLKCFAKGSNVVSILGCVFILDSPDFS